MHRAQAAAGLITGGALLLALGFPAPAALAKAPTTIVYTDQVWSTDGVLNPFNNSAETLGDGWYFSPLAAFKWTSATAYYPQLASSWKWERHDTELVVQLNPKAGWSNGTPVTSQDVVTTWELEFEEDVAQGYFITKVEALGPKTVAFFRSSTVAESPTIFEYEVLTQPVYAAANFASYVPKNIWTLVAQSEQYPITKTVNSALSKLSSLGVTAAGHGFQPNQLLYDGPWALSKISSSQQLLVKNPHFFAAQNVTADRVIYYNETTNDLAWRLLEANEADGANVALTPPVWRSISAVSGNHLALTGPAQGMLVQFNFKDYPFNLRAVRQALAYAMDRTQVQKIAEPVSGYAVKWQDGTYNNFNLVWLTSGERAELNPYNHNLAKAAALLRSAGFKDTKGGWLMPNGKPFKFNLYVMAPFSDYVEAADVLASEWSKFGIHVAADVENGNIFFTDQEAGDYPVSIAEGDTSLFPYYQFNFYETYDNYGVNSAGQLYKTSSTAAEQNIPVVDNVPGLGAVHPLTLDWQLMFNQSAAVTKKDVWELAKTTNYVLPQIQVFGQYSSNVISTSRWSWPSLHNPVWYGFGYGYGFIPLFQSLGLMRPK